MGNSLGCSASGERLVSAARDGDLLEAKMLLEFNPWLAKYSTFGGLNSPLHFAASKGHNDIVVLLLESGADVNSRNYCGQTALMQACRYGHWEVVQTLLLCRSNVTRTDYLNGRTALHFAAVEGNVRCIRLVVADFVPSGPYEFITSPGHGSNSSGDGFSSPGRKYDHIALAKFLNKPADGGITALHMAALNGHFDCVHLLLDLNANISAATFHYGSSTNLIGAGSTPLHYAACGGNIKCCQVLIARGASRLTLNCNGWLPVDVARIWGHHWLETLLAPNTDAVVLSFPPSKYLALPLMSILNIARECGLQSSTAIPDDGDVCAVCLERACTVAAEGCAHQLCTKCALCLCSSSISAPTSEIAVTPGSIPCPLCRHGLVSFVKLPSLQTRELKSKLALGLCNPCMVQASDPSKSMVSCRSDTNKINVSSSSEVMCPVSCSPFPSVSMPLCSCNDGPCMALEADTVARGQSPRRCKCALNERDNPEELGIGKPSCSNIFRSRRSCHREQQCNSEINV